LDEALEDDDLFDNASFTSNHHSQSGRFSDPASRSRSSRHEEETHLVIGSYASHDEHNSAQNVGLERNNNGSNRAAQSLFTGHTNEWTGDPYANQNEFTNGQSYGMYGRGDTLTTGNHIPGNQYYDDEEVGSGHTYEEHKYASQLQVLYEARGRKIESLQKESEEREEGYAKEMRILNHRLILATGKHAIHN